MNAPVPAMKVEQVCRDLVFEALVDTASLTESFAISLREAAWRGDERLVRLYLAQCRSTLLTAISQYKQLETGATA